MMTFLFFALAFLEPVPASGDSPKCVTQKFQTVLVKKACEKGGQKLAVTEMRKWMKNARKHPEASGKKIKCDTCHNTMAPKYDLNGHGLKLYRKLGGK